MDKALRIGRTSAAGSLQLFFGKTLSTGILAIGAIVLSMLILEGDYGLYVVALIPATTILLFQDWGVGYALTRHCAKCRSENKENELRPVIVAGLVFEVGTGAVLTAVSLLLTPFIASAMFNKPEATFLMSIASVTILTSAIANTPSNVFVGFEKMKLSSVTLLCGALIQSLLAPLLVFLGYGALGAMVGYIIGFAVTAGISMVFLYFSVFRKLPPKKKSYRQELSKTLRPLLKYGVPIALGAIFAGMFGQFMSFMMASFCSNAVIGSYKVAANFAILLTFFSFPITTVLFPAFSKIDPKKERDLLKTIFSFSTKYTSFLIVPATMAIIVLSDTFIHTLYGAKWLDSSLFLVLSVVGNLLAVLGVIGLQSLLTALAETKLYFATNLLTFGIMVVLAFLGAPTFGMTGILVAALFASLPSIALTLYVVWKRYDITVNFKDALKMLLASGIAALPTLALLNVLTNVFAASALIKLVLGALVFLGTYIFAVALVRAMTHADIVNLRSMFSGMNVVSNLLEIPLTIMEKMMLLQTKPKWIEHLKRKNI